MKTRIVIATLAAAVAAPSLAFAQFEQFRGKMKEGLYEYKMDMDMGSIPGMPPGMGKQSHTMQHCLRHEDIERGGLNKGRDGKGMPENCKIENMKMSGNRATSPSAIVSSAISANASSEKLASTPIFGLISMHGSSRAWAMPD